MKLRRYAGKLRHARLWAQVREMRAQLEQVARSREALHPVWTPYQGPQALGYDSLADELFYGGAAGGGKSDLLLGLAGTRHRKSLILRRESTQLRELIDRAHQLFNDFGRFNGSTGTWRIRTGGVNRAIELAGVKDEQDKQKWKGRAHDLKAFDE